MKKSLWDTPEDAQHREQIVGVYIYLYHFAKYSCSNKEKEEARCFVFPGGGFESLEKNPHLIEG